MADPWASLANMQGYQDEFLHSQPPPLARNEESQASVESSAAGQSASKRQVNSNACEPCRKRKSKCDGRKPFCFSCTTLHMTQCNYDINKDLRRKGALRQEIQRLKNTSDNYQFVLDSLCLAEEPHLEQLMRLIRSNQPIEVIADTWRSSGLALLDQLPLFDFEEISEDKGFGGSMGGPPFVEMATNQTNITIRQSHVQTTQPSMNISASSVQINQPGMPMPMPMPIISGITGVPDVPGIPVMSDQLGLQLNHGMNTNAFTGPQENQEALLNLNGWYDEWGRMWPRF